jgi:hypothetical protein
MKDMRHLISIVESLAIDRKELDAPDVIGVTDIEVLTQMLKVPDQQTFRNAMRKIIMNRSESMNDFEVLEVARAFINFVSMGTEEGIRVAMLLGHVTKKRGGENGDELPDDLADELADELDIADVLNKEPEIPEPEMPEPTELPKRHKPKDSSEEPPQQL